MANFVSANLYWTSTTKCQPVSTIDIYWPSTSKYQLVSLITHKWANKIISLFTTHLTSHAQYTWSFSLWQLDLRLSTTLVQPPHHLYSFPWLWPVWWQSFNSWKCILSGNEQTRKIYLINVYRNREIYRFTMDQSQNQMSPFVRNYLRATSLQH